MKKIPFYNEKINAVWVGMVMVPPSSTRMVDAALLPPQPQVADEPESEPDALADLLKGTAAEVVASLPTLSLAETEHLGELEQIGQQRKGILSAIAERLLSEASKKEGGGL